MSSVRILLGVLLLCVVASAHEACTTIPMSTFSSGTQHCGMLFEMYCLFFFVFFYGDNSMHFLRLVYAMFIVFILFIFIVFFFSIEIYLHSIHLFVWFICDLYSEFMWCAVFALRK